MCGVDRGKVEWYSWYDTLHWRASKGYGWGHGHGSFKRDEDITCEVLKHKKFHKSKLSVIYVQFPYLKTYSKI